MGNETANDLKGSQVITDMKDITHVIISHSSPQSGGLIWTRTLSLSNIHIPPRPAGKPNDGRIYMID